MDTGGNIPVTIQCNGQYTQVVIGNTRTSPPKEKEYVNEFWYVVVDLSNPTAAPVVNVLDSDNSRLPAAIQPYVGKDGFMLCFAFLNVLTSHIPQTGLFLELRRIGSGPQLRRIEQLVEQIGSNVFDVANYALAATMLDTDAPGFEAANFYNPALLTFQLMPITVEGKTVYSPIQLGA